jgi:hypothetical protein
MRTLRQALFALLIVVELWLFTGFLPEKWQERVYARHDYSRITHPNLEYELQPFKSAGLALLSFLVVLNGAAIIALRPTRKRR